jgi:hypothetical protein
VRTRLTKATVARMRRVAALWYVARASGELARGGSDLVRNRACLTTERIPNK